MRKGVREGEREIRQGNQKCRGEVEEVGEMGDGGMEGSIDN